MSLRRFVSNLSIVTCARFLGAGIGFATQITLARLLPPESLGSFFFATSLAAVLAIVAARGLPNIATRFIVSYRQRNMNAAARAFESGARKLAAHGSLAVTGLLCAILYLLPGLSGATRLALALGALATPALALARINCEIA